MQAILLLTGVSLRRHLGGTTYGNVRFRAIFAFLRFFGLFRVFRSNAAKPSRLAKPNCFLHPLLGNTQSNSQGNSQGNHFGRFQIFEFIAKNGEKPQYLKKKPTSLLSRRKALK